MFKFKNSNKEEINMYYYGRKEEIVKFFKDMKTLHKQICLQNIQKHPLMIDFFVLIVYFVS